MKNIVFFQVLSTLIRVPVCAQTVDKIPGSSSPTGITKATTTGVSAKPDKRPITLNDAVSIFLQQNLQLVAARYDIDMADA